MKIKRRYILILSAVLVLLALSIVIASLLIKDPKDVFPVWVEAEEMEGSPYAELSVTEVERGVPFEAFEDGTKIARIHLSVENTNADAALEYTKSYHVDYFFENQWYTVYYPEIVPSVAIFLDPEGSSKQVYTVSPSEILDAKGEYRLYADGLGYCNFEIK